MLAERLASQHGARVLLIDRRPHVGGNAYDEPNEAGILYHKYGPHIFHTNSEQVVDYLSQFTEWRPYEHRVLRAWSAASWCRSRSTARRSTCCSALDLKTDEEAAEYLASRAEPVEDIQTSEDVVVNAVGRELYELFFRGYTRKQWGLDPSELDKSVTARIPTRTNTDDRYFTRHVPGDAEAWLHRDVREDARPSADRSAHRRRLSRQGRAHEVDSDHLIFTGPIDEYFDHPLRQAALPQPEVRPPDARAGAVPAGRRPSIIPREDIPFTRISEYKHLTGQESPVTTITYEYPSAEGDPYYPIPRPENQELFKRYEALADATEDVTFVGRLATYRYYNMDQIVGQALATFRRMDEKRQRSRRGDRGRRRISCQRFHFGRAADPISPHAFRRAILQSPRPFPRHWRAPTPIRCWTRIFPTRR